MVEGRGEEIRRRGGGRRNAIITSDLTRIYSVYVTVNSKTSVLCLSCLAGLISSEFESLYF